ncbi:unnamed protein product [Symbiodinium necroappetens]|uniref:Uncharacterized protein n=1 Tax=Symbiodinium necroappetens TaxID=1628268 RepID=A0A812UGZ1_9DINO|nr:unnamed protein product [Symbiodinium necroappetens]
MAHRAPVGARLGKFLEIGDDEATVQPSQLPVAAKGDKKVTGSLYVMFSRVLAILMAFWCVPSARGAGIAMAATLGYLVAAFLGKTWTVLNARRVNTILCFAVSCWFWVLFWPIFLYCAAWNNRWVPGFRALRPGYLPEGCDTAKLVQDILRMGDFAADTVHWDAAAQRCDCRLPDRDDQGGRCKSNESERFPSFTVVSALIEAGRRGRSGCDYLRMFGPHLHRQYDLVFYGEAWALEVVFAVRTKLGLQNRTRLRLLEVAKDSEESAASKWGKPATLAFHHLLEEMQVIADRKYCRYLLNRFVSGVSGKMIANYGWVVHEKANFIVQAVQENYFRNSSSNFNLGNKYFIWVDVGTGHGAIQVPEHFCACNVAVPGTVTLFHQLNSKEELFLGSDEAVRRVPQPLPLGQLTFSKYLSTYDFTHHFDEVIGTFWGGDPAALEKLWQDYSGTVHRLLANGAIGQDQAVLCLVASRQWEWLRYIPSNFYGVTHLC